MLANKRVSGKIRRNSNHNVKEDQVVFEDIINKIQDKERPKVEVIVSPYRNSI